MCVNGMHAQAEKEKSDDRPLPDYSRFARNVSVFECQECGRLHKSSDSTFLLIAGNILIGMGGGLIRTNFDARGELEDVAVWCRTEACVGKMLDYLRKAALEGEEPVLLW